MKTLNIAPYDMPAPASITEGVLKTGGTQPYPIKDSLVNILFAQPGLKARDLLRRDDIARKVLNADSDELTLEDAEFDQLKAAVEQLEGYGRHDVELVRRVLDIQ